MEKKKKMLLISLCIAVIAILLIMIMPSNSGNYSSSNAFEDQTVQNLRFTDAKISNNTLSVRVQNTTARNYSLKSITVNFIDQNNNTIISINGFIGDEIYPNEIRNLNVKSDVDISNLKNITYTVNKQ